MKQTMIVIAAALSVIAPAAAKQEPGQQLERRVASVEAGQIERARTMVESRVVVGAPYSAEAITESVQVLADGNRIARKSVAKVYRDGEGRTRREELGEKTGEPLTISISDPVAESVYMLDPRNKTAYRNGVIVATPQGFAMATTTPGGRGTVTAVKTPDGQVSVSASEAGASSSASGERVTYGVARSGGPGSGGGVASGGGRGEGRGVGGAVTVAPGGAPPGAYGGVPGGAPANVTREELGSQMVEGVMATGTRTTTVIDAGVIGNAQPIRIVSEQWFSPDLKVLVMTKHSDPRTGETTYRLTNVAQAEPAHVLFEVPADYTLKDSVIRRQ
jgi:hypothetical protein